MADYPQIERMGHAFHTAAKLPVEYHEPSFRSVCERLMADERSLLLMVPGGMLAAMAFPYYFNSAVLTAQELFWWVDPEVRGHGIAGELLREAENWAREKGAKTMQMISLAELDGEAIGRMYERHGYVPLERSYLKVL